MTIWISSTDKALGLNAKDNPRSIQPLRGSRYETFFHVTIYVPAVQPSLLHGCAIPASRNACEFSQLQSKTTCSGTCSRSPPYLGPHPPLQQANLCEGSTTGPQHGQSSTQRSEQKMKNQYLLYKRGMWCRDTAKV